MKNLAVDLNKKIKVIKEKKYVEAIRTTKKNVTSMSVRRKKQKNAFYGYAC